MTVINRTATEVQMEMEKLALQQQQEMLQQYTADQARNSIWGGQGFAHMIHTNGSAGLMNVAQKQMAQNMTSRMSMDFGVLYLDGKPLPDDWHGAKITDHVVRVSEEGWFVEYRSKWSDKIIYLRLDHEEMSGKEARAVALTYLEALNQRRLG